MLAAPNGGDMVGGEAVSAAILNQSHHDLLSEMPIQTAIVCCDQNVCTARVGWDDLSEESFKGISRSPVCR